MLPNDAAQAAGVEVVNSLAYLVGLYEQRRITPERALHALDAFLSAVETLSKVNEDPEFYNLAVKAVRA